MSRYLVINETNMEIFVENEYDCLYKTNNICFNNNCKWLGKKCYTACNKFKEEILKLNED